MSLADITSIDLVTRLPNDQARAILLTYDNGEVRVEREREDALQSKLMSYLLFVESGQFAETYPSLADAELSVEVVCSTAPTEGMRLIDGLRSQERSDLFIPVNVVEETEFREKIGLPE